MVKKYIKLIMKNPYRDKLLKMVDDIAYDNLSWYDVKRLNAPWEVFRIRIGDVRCVFSREKWGNVIVRIDTRWDAYKWL